MTNRQHRQQWHCPVSDCSAVIKTSVKPHHNLLIVGHLYYQHLLSTIDTAELLGVDQWHVHYRLMQSGLRRRSFSEAQTIRQQRYPLSEESRTKLSKAGQERRYSKVRNGRISRSLRAYHYGRRIISKLQEMDIDIELAHQLPREVGRAMMGIAES